MLIPAFHLNLSLLGALRLGPGVWFRPTPHLPPFHTPCHLLPCQSLPWLTIRCYKTFCCLGCSHHGQLLWRNDTSTLWLLASNDAVVAVVFATAQQLPVAVAVGARTCYHYCRLLLRKDPPLLWLLTCSNYAVALPSPLQRGDSPLSWLLAAGTRRC